eukprot:TRINITY_DN10010_c0_g1_i1.p1 TRINITY_DN10010_c0_g1~~TRINITY_DN10010_c0_g1_i1.p1  ORF type:complete len:670 (-),score=116.60 TRINITY_DN10010_c0_g1_i1:337-2346(-)
MPAPHGAAVLNDPSLRSAVGHASGDYAGFADPPAFPAEPLRTATTIELVLALSELIKAQEEELHRQVHECLEQRLIGNLHALLGHQPETAAGLHLVVHSEIFEPKCQFEPVQANVVVQENKPPVVDEVFLAAIKEMEEVDTDVSGNASQEQQELSRAEEDCDDELSQQVGAASADEEDGEEDEETDVESADSDAAQQKLSSMISADLSKKMQFSNNGNWNSDSFIELPTSDIRTTAFCATRLVKMQGFEIVCALFICFNVVVIGMEVDYAASAETNSRPNIYRLCEYLTTAWFTLELLLRVAGKGFRHFCCRSRDLTWNYLDVFIVAASLTDAVIMLAGSGWQSSLFLALKVFRVLRLVRITKTSRFFHNLRIMVYSMLQTLQALLWFLVLMGVSTYCFAICLTQGAVDHAIAVLGEQSDWKTLAESGPDYMPRLLKDFGSVPRTMFTLLKCISGGVSWGEPGDLVAQLGPTFMVTFLVFINFTIFAMLNVITGFFCEEAVATAARDRSDIIQKQIQDKDECLKKFKSVFAEIDSDCSGYITFNELAEQIGNQDLLAYFAHLEINVRDAWEIFRLLDQDSSGTVSMEEFVVGCMRLRGYAKTLDVISSNYDMERCQRKTFDKLHKLEFMMTQSLRAQGIATKRHPGRRKTPTARYSPPSVVQRRVQNII